jgi:flagellar hook-associated protein 1
MSLSTALTNASTGLAGSSRLADTISNNVANAMTPGFGRRTTELTSLTLGGYGSGVRVLGTWRAENPLLTSERRAADAALGAATVVDEAYQRIMAAVGEPTETTALASRVVALETALLGATASPHSVTKLTQAVDAAGDLAATLRGVSEENVRIRTEAEAEIARQVDFVNAALHTVSEINDKIASMTLTEQETAALEDERGRLIDGIASIVPVRVANREGGRVAVYAQNGGVLLDSRVWELSFTATSGPLLADMTLGAPLNGLAQDRGNPAGPEPVAVGGGAGLFDGGSLAALFEVRDRVVPEFNAEIDRFAEDLITRFRDLMPPAALDGAGDGLFVDGGTGGLAGLAGRLEINAAVDPAAGGAVWRLRDGLGAVAPGPEGFGDYLAALSDAAVAAQPGTGFVSLNAPNGAAGIAAEIASFFGGKVARSEDRQAYLSAQQAILAERETHALGVDSDAELQYLMLVEQTYAANARVLSVVDSLMQKLLEI